MTINTVSSVKKNLLGGMHLSGCHLSHHARRKGKIPTVGGFFLKS